MHALVRWIDCEDPKCRCNEWLAKQPALNIPRKEKPGPEVGQMKKLYESPSERRAKNAARQREWRHRNKQAVQS